jgi:hypothetical protein
MSELLGRWLTTACTRLGYRRAFRILHPHWNLLLGEGAHAAAAKRVKPTVSGQSLLSNMKRSIAMQNKIYEHSFVRKMFFFNTVGWTLGLIIGYYLASFYVETIDWSIIDTVNDSIVESLSRGVHTVLMLAVIGVVTGIIVGTMHIYVMQLSFFKGLVYVLYMVFRLIFLFGIMLPLMWSVFGPMTVYIESIFGKVIGLGIGGIILGLVSSLPLLTHYRRQQKHQEKLDL